MSKLWLMLALACIIAATSTSAVFGQYAQDPDWLQKRCVDLDIDPSNCSVQEISKKARVCPTVGCNSQPPDPKYIVIPLLFGSGVAMAVGILGVRAISKTKPQSKP